MSLGSHDKSLKYLLSQEPTDFIRFGLRTEAIRVVRPVEGDLPARDRTVDGGYLVERSSRMEVSHVEFSRRHKRLADLALDIGEAQIRLHRRERVPVHSLLWDLYGSRKDPVVQERAIWLGQEGDSGSSRVVYLRVNLRGMGAAELLEAGPRTLYPLVPLTADGADIAQVRRAMAAIEARTDLGPAQRADHLAVLRFLAEAEDVPVHVLESYLTREKMMESSFYCSILAEGKAEGQAEDLLQILITRLGKVPPEVRQIVMAQAKTSPETLSAWFNEVVLALDAEAALRLVRKITAT